MRKTILGVLFLVGLVVLSGGIYNWIGDGKPPLQVATTKEFIDLSGYGMTIFVGALILLAGILVMLAWFLFDYLLGKIEHKCCDCCRCPNCIAERSENQRAEGRKRISGR